MSQKLSNVNRDGELKRRGKTLNWQTWDTEKEEEEREWEILGRYLGKRERMKDREKENKREREKKLGIYYRGRL